MKDNLGDIDRGMRIVIGTALLVVFFDGPSALALVGLLTLVTALFGFCPLYHLVGISTRTRGAARERRA